MRAVLAILLVLMAARGEAGPWPRDPQTVFLSVQQELGGWTTARPTQVTRIFGEYGLGRGWTVGLDGAVPAAGPGTPQGLVFLRRSRETRLGWVAAEAGAGLYGWPGRSQEVQLRPALHWGRGLGGRWPGWTTVRLAAVIRPASGAVLWTADGMVGLRPTDRLALMLGSEFAANNQGFAAVSLVPGLSFRVLDRLDLVGSVRVPLGDPSAASVQLGTWLRF